MSEPDATVLTFLHISDIHFQPDNEDQKIVLSQLLSKIRHMSEGRGKLVSEWFKGKLCLDFIFCSGDIANFGKPREYKIAKQFFNNLLDVTGLKKERLFFVPGNHDVDPDRLPDLTVSIESDEDSDHFFSPKGKLKKFLEPFQGYQEFTREYFPERQFDESRCYYTEILKTRGVRVGIAGLNSAWPLEKWGKEAEKERFQLLGKRPLDEALESLSEADLKIVLFHHPVSWLHEVEDHIIKRLLGENANLVLTGHQLKPSVVIDIKPTSEVKIWQGQRKVLTIQAAPTYKKSVPNRVQICKLQVWGNHMKGVLIPLRFDRETNRWIWDTSAYDVKDGYIFQFDIGEKEFPYRLQDMRFIPRQIIPFENKVLKKGVWTQLERPSLEDFEQERVAIRENIVHSVLGELKQKNFGVVEGPRDSGKTWLCYAIGFELKRKKIASYFVEVDEGFDANKLWSFIRGFKGNEDVVWFIEDCHNNIDGVRELYMLLQSDPENLRFILNTRKRSVLDIFGKSRKKRSEVCFEVSLGKSEAEALEHVKQIIRKFIQTEEVKLGVTEEEIEHAARKWGNDLEGVNLRLAAWKSKLEDGALMRLTEVEDTRVYDYLWDPRKKVQLERDERREALLPVATLCQFEPLSVFVPYFGDNALKTAYKLEDEGLLDRVKWKGKEYFRMREGRADWILRTLSYKMSPEFVGKETKRVFKEYFKSKPPNWTYVFYCLNLRQDTPQVEEILRAVFEDEGVWETIREMVEKELFFSLEYFPVVSQAMVEHGQKEKEIWGSIRNKGLNWILGEISECKISVLAKLLVNIRRLDGDFFKVIVTELNRVPRGLEKSLEEGSIGSLCWLCHTAFFAYPGSRWSPLSELIVKNIEDKLKSGSANCVRQNLPSLNGMRKIVTLEEFFANFRVSDWKKTICNSSTFDSIYHLFHHHFKKWKLKNAAKTLGKALIEIGIEDLIMQKHASSYRLCGTVRRGKELGLDVRPLVKGVIQSNVRTLRQLFLIQKSRVEGEVKHGESKGAFLFGLNGICEIAEELGMHSSSLIKNISNFNAVELRELFSKYCDATVASYFFYTTATQDPSSCTKIIRKVDSDTWSEIVHFTLSDSRQRKRAFLLLWDIYCYDRTIAKQIAQRTKREFFNTLARVRFPEWSVPTLGLMQHFGISIKEILDQIPRKKVLQIVEEYRKQLINDGKFPATELLLSLIALSCKLPKKEFEPFKEQVINETRVKEKIKKGKLGTPIKKGLQEIIDTYEF